MSYKWIVQNPVQGISGKKILIAGGTGFIGERVVTHLKKLGVQVFVLTRQYRQDSSNVKYLHADLNDFDALSAISRDYSFDILVYLAAHIPVVGAKKESYFDAKRSTLDPFLNFCECFSESAEKLVYASTVDVLGRCGIHEFPDDESVNPNKPTPYGLAKYCGELYAKHWCEISGLKNVILRFSQVYGPNEPLVRIIPILKRNFIMNSTFTLYTNGEEKRRFLYIDDAAQAIIRSIGTDVEGVFNIAGNEIVSINETIKTMERIWNRKLDLVVLGQVDGVNTVPSIRKAQDFLHYQPEVSLEQGLVMIKGEDTNA